MIQFANISEIVNTHTFGVLLIGLFTSNSEFWWLVKNGGAKVSWIHIYIEMILSFYSLCYGWIYVIYKYTNTMQKPKYTSLHFIQIRQVLVWPQLQFKCKKLSHFKVAQTKFVREWYRNVMLSYTIAFLMQI